MARRATRAAAEWRRVAVVRSHSGDDPHDITSNGDLLRCDCMSWRFCPNPKTCRHVEEATPYIERAGGVALVYRLLGSGLHLDTSGGVNRSVMPTQARPRSLADRIERLLTNVAGPQAVALAEWRTLRAELESAPRGVPAAAAVAIVDDATDWLGGGRAILLRD